MDFPTTRMRRLRKNENIRDMVRETKLLKEDLIYPIFVPSHFKQLQPFIAVEVSCLRN